MKGPLPPAIFLMSVASMVILHALVPSPQLRSWLLRGPGALLVAGGLGLSAWGSRLFQRVGTNIKPFERPQRLVRDGPFRYSRNPMYLGLLMALFGVWLLLGSPAPGAIIPIFVAIISRRFIRFEERMMAATFGDDYAAYCRVTPRWL